VSGRADDTSDATNVGAPILKRPKELCEDYKCVARTRHLQSEDDRI